MKRKIIAIGGGRIVVPEYKIPQTLSIEKRHSIKLISCHK